MLFPPRGEESFLLAEERKEQRGSQKDGSFVSVAQVA